MRILIADDNPGDLFLVQEALEDMRCELVQAIDGAEAAAVLFGDAPPGLALLDWKMPHTHGVDLCRQVRQRGWEAPPYLILLTGHQGGVVEGLEAGADDYVVKPFQREELRARVKTGVRVIDLQQQLARKVADLEHALAQVHDLEGLLPICMYCKKIRDSEDYWERIESYIAQRSAARFSHSVCPSCYEEKIQPQLDKLG